MRFKDDEWQNVVDVAQLPSAVVTDFLASDAGIWIGTEAGLAFHSFADESTSISAELQGVSVEAMARDGLDRLWVGTRDSGIWIREPAGEWTQMLPDEDRMGSLPSSGVLAGGLVADRQSDAGMWAISVDQALIHWDGLRWQEVDQSSELPSNLLYRLFTDPIDGSLWIGSEAGVTHYDGRTWGTFSADDGLQSTAIYAIALEKEGVYWFGGPEGLTRYRPDRTAPWIRVDTLDGALESETGEILAELENPFSIHLEAGDLQTAQDDLAIFYRTSDADVWRDLPDRRLQVLVDELGAYQYEFVARDRAFNYSPIIGQTLSVVAPPELINLPVLGEVEQNIFWTLVALGVLALLGFGYVSLEIIQTRVRTIRAINRGFNPYVSGEPVRTVDMFFGRHELLQRVVDTLHNNSIMIHGERRIGKTTLLYQLGNVLREVEDPEYWFMPVYLDLEGTAQEDFFHFLIEEIAMAVLKLPGHEETLPIVVSTLRYHTLASDQYSDRDFNHDMRRLIGALHRYGEVNFAQKQLRVILLMDEMDVMSTYDHLVQQRLRRIFMRDFAATLGAIVAGIQISKEWDRVESPWFNLFNEIEVQPFSREQAEELLIEPVRDFYFYELEALDFIIDQSGGRPFRVQQYALEAVNHMLAQKRRRITLEDVQVAHELIQSSDVTHHQQDGLHPVHTAPIDSLQEVIA